MKMNLKLEILKIFLVDFNWETGDKKSTEKVDGVVEESATVDSDMSSNMSTTETAENKT